MAGTTVATHSLRPTRTNDDESDVGPAQIVCGHCGAKFTPRRHWQRFCSATCRFSNWNEANPRQREVNERLTRIEQKIDALRLLQGP